MPTTCRVAPGLAALLVPLEDLHPDPRNARAHDERNLAAICMSYERFGQQKPIVVDAAGQVVAGNGQLAAARRLGWIHIAAIRTDLAGAEALAYALADNRTAELAGWDDAALKALIEDLQEEDAALIAAAGFDEADINAILSPPPPPPGLDRVPAPPDAATTRPGDLLTLGDHHLLCGDAGSREDLDRLLGGGVIHLVNTDPPYNVKVEPRSSNAIAAGLSSFVATERSHPRLMKNQHFTENADRQKARNRGLLHHQSFDVARLGQKAATTDKMRPKDRPLANDFVTDAAFVELLRAWFGQAARVLAPGRAFYIWGGYANVANYPPALKEAGLYFSQTIIWIKEHPVLTRKDFMGNHEWCFYGWREGAAHWFAPGLHNVPDVWDVAREAAEKSHPLGDGLVIVSGGREVYVGPVPKRHLRRIEVAEDHPARFHLDGPTDVWRVKKIPPQRMVHLTEKPAELAMRAMHYSSRRGENVLDLFGGSGSTLMGAEAAGRHAYLMELDPLYCDVIVQRWEEFTGRKAERQRP
jgi:DNA modification methylase